MVWADRLKNTDEEIRDGVWADKTKVSAADIADIKLYNSILYKSIDDIASVFNAMGAVSIAAYDFESKFSAADAALVSDNSNLTAPKSASIFNDSNLTAPKSASIFNDSNLTASKSASIFNDSNLTAAKLISILDDTNITSAKIKSIFETGLLSVDEKRAAVLEGDQYAAADAADSVNGTFYTDDQLALAFDNTNLTAAKSASIFENTNISIAKIDDILDNANISDSRASDIIYETAVATRDLSSASNIIGTAEILEDWQDNKLTSRDSEATTPILTPSPYVQDANTFRPDWTTESGTPSVTNNRVSGGEVSISSSQYTGTWETSISTPSNSSYGSRHVFRFIYVDTSNYYFIYSAAWNAGTNIYFYKRVTDTNTSLLSIGHIYGIGTYKITRDAGYNFEVFANGVSKGTVTDSDLTSSSKIWLDTDSYWTVGYIKVY